MIVAVVLIQILALGHFFLSLVALMNDSLSGFIILLVLGLFWEGLFIHFVRQMIKEKSVKIEEPQPADATEWAENLYDDHGLNYSGACEQYCRQHGKKEEELTKEEKDIVWEYAYDDFTYLLMWIIENDFYQPSADFDEDGARDARAYVAKIKRREINPTAYLNGNDGIFLEDEIKKEARAFVIGYYKGPYMDELRKFSKDTLHAELHGFPFRFEDYDAFKVHIDAAYEAYVKKLES
ncbi:MAG: hypothetical protein J5750_09130 [Clostridiales bacterium]|nr:hypothetical protein [Clostridiales bacterium]